MTNIKEKMTADVSVPVGIVNELEKLSGGINSIKDDLKQNHLIDAKFEGNILHLTGPNESILDIANEFLHAKVGRANATKKTLGGKGTVAWTYKGKPVKHIKYLFDAEYKELSTVKTIKTAEPKADILVISCGYADYQTVNDMLEELDKKIKNCKQKAVKVDVKDQQLAKKFEKEQVGHAFYCCLIVDTKDKSKVELEFYGRKEKDCQDGISMWETIKQGDKKKSASSSTSTWNFKENESVKDGSILQEHKPTGQQKNRNSYQATAPATLDAKHATNTKELDTGQRASISAHKIMDADWDETTNATGSSSTGSTNLSKPQMNVSSTSNEFKSNAESKSSNTSTTASASVRPKENMHPRAAALEVKKTPGTTIGSGEKAKYSFQIRNMQIYVYKESITEIKGMDAITNAANDRLMHGGGVAYYISKAAGKRMDQDCNSFITKNGRLQVTRNYVSVPGDMKCKGIIHAVGPTWYDYTDKRDDCARDLYETIKNILITANNNKWQKVALSAISSGLFGVPKKLCAEMYIKAFADYGTEADGTLKEVHFIDLNREILDTVIETHKTWMIDASKLDFKNALEYVPAWEKKQTRRGAGSEKQGGLIHFLGTDQTSYGETRHKYRVCKKLDIFVYKGSLTRLETVDAIALTIAPDPKYIGALEYSVRAFAGSKYASEVDKYRNGKNGRVFVSKGAGSLRCNNVVHIIPSPEKGLGRDLSSVFSEVYGLALTFSNKIKMRSLGMPLFGAGGAYSKADIQVLCNRVIHTLISLCCDSSTRIQFEQLHLVNLERSVSVCLQEEFTRLSKVMKESKDMKEADKSKHDIQTTHFSSYFQGPNAEHHPWIPHVPLEESKSEKAKPANDSKNKIKETKGKAVIEKAPSDGMCIYCNTAAQIKVKECQHMYCPACAVSVQTSSMCLKCSRSSRDTTVKAKDVDENCPICLEPPKKVEVLPCRHALCHTCYEAVKKQKPQCPICQHIFGDVTGNQPNGDMLYRYVPGKSLPGYDGCGTIDILYVIPSGKQEKCHPHPGKFYRGFQRRAYLPDNKEGNKILYLIRRAFDRKLVFTIGESRTTGKEDVVTWNDIHHKTNPYGGPEKFGYPDPTYLARVREELAAKGVTE